MGKSLAEQLAIERDQTVPDADLATDTSRIRRVMMRARDGFTLDSVSEAIGKPNTGPVLVSQAMKIMRLVGFTFTSEATGVSNQMRHVLTNPWHHPSDADLERMRTATRGDGSRKQRTAEIVERNAERERARLAKQAQRAKSKEVAVVPRVGLATNGHSQELLEALPRLTEAVHVVGLVINDDGDVSMVLRNANGQRLAVDVHGATALP